MARKIDWSSTKKLLPPFPTEQTTKEFLHFLLNRTEHSQAIADKWFEGPGFWVSGETKMMLLVERDHYRTGEMTTEQFGEWFDKEVLPELRTFYSKTL